jgi:predicted nucleic acid-binding protein
MKIRTSLYTTEAVLTEAFHLLEPGSRGTEGLMQFVIEGYVSIVPPDKDGSIRAFELMNKYADCPMDYADASIIVIAEVLKTLSVFTLVHLVIINVTYEFSRALRAYNARCCRNHFV